MSSKGGGRGTEEGVSVPLKDEPQQREGQEEEEEHEEQEGNASETGSSASRGISPATVAALNASLCRKRRRKGGDDLALLEGGGGGGGGGSALPGAAGSSTSLTLLSASLSRSRSLPLLAGARGPVADEPIQGEYATEMLQLMRRLRDKGALCDVVVRGNKVEVRAHRLVLAAASEYFRACLTGSMQESSEKVINLAGMDDGALGELVNFAYCGRVHLTEETVLELLVAANRLQMPQVMEQCCDYLLQRMDSTNCLTILSIANTYSCASMRTRAEAYINRHFELVYQGDEFLAIPVDQLLQLLSSESVSVASEETTFRAVSRWVMHDFEGRRPHILPLLQTVRLELVPTSFIADVIHEHELVQRCPETERVLLEAYRWHNSAFQDTRAKLCNYVRKQAIRPVIYTIGGDDGHDDRNPYASVMYFDTQLGTWHHVAPLQQKRSVCGAATLGFKIYVVGGYNGERAVETVEEFDPSTNSWRNVASLAQRRCSCGCAVLNGELYVVGGVCGPLALSEVEKYNPLTDTWTAAPAMQDGRSGCGVAELGEVIYAVGGINGNGETVCTAECFIPWTQRWQSIQSMHTARRSFGLAALGGLLYACGGNDGVNDLNALEVYDPLTNRWKTLAPMRYARMYCSVAVLDGKLYAVGGLDGSTTLDVVEVFDPRRNSWEEVPPKLEHKVCGCGLVVSDCVVMPEHQGKEKEKKGAGAVDV